MSFLTALFGISSSVPTVNTTDATNPNSYQEFETIEHNDTIDKVEVNEVNEVVVNEVVNVEVNEVNEVINNQYVYGENGSIEYSPDAISDKLLAMFFKMVRNTSETDLESLFSDYIASMMFTSLANRINMATNLFLLCFLTRNCRGGKGEKALFYKTFELLASKFPETIHLTIHLIPEFGYWRDIFTLIERNRLPKITIEKLLDLVAKQLRKDSTEERPSLLTKWIPEEKSALYKHVTKALLNNGFHNFAYEIMSRIKVLNNFSKNHVHKEYRLFIGNITSKLNIVETKMCSGNWSDIEFDKVPSIAMTKYAHAFDLTDQKKVIKKRNEPTIDRLECKEHYISQLIDGKVNGSQIAIDKLIESVFEFKFGIDLSLTSLRNKGPYNLLLAHRQFESYVDYVQQQLNIASEESKEKVTAFTFSPDNCEVMIDVSGSMAGQPMYAAIGIGLLIMSLQKKKDNLSFLTFSSNPAYIDITECMSLPDTVHKIKCSPWGCSTDFIKAFDLMLMKSGNNIINAKKTLIVLSDMQFNIAVNRNSNWETMYDTICTKWKNWYNVGDDNLPTIVFWNLRGDTVGHPVTSNIKGVTEISGYSASLFKMVLFGEELAQTVDPITGNTEKPSPSQVLARTLNSKEYDCVKEAIGWKDGILYNDTFKEECKAL